MTSKGISKLNENLLSKLFRVGFYDTQFCG